MRYKYPDYYKEFQCTAHLCEATCCAGWEIVIDEESMDKYLTVKSDFGKRLCNSIDFQEGIFHQDYQKRCAFLNKENLCDIYQELGEEYLCYTCMRYPRHIEEYEELNEVSLSISCPEVCKILLEKHEVTTFYEEDVIEDVEEFEDFDFLFYELLVDVRTLVFTILQNRELDLKVRMYWAAVLTQEVQEQVDAFHTFGINDVIDKHSSMQDSEIVKQYGDKSTPISRYQFMQEGLQDLYRLEVLDERFRPYLLHTQEVLYQEEIEGYDKLWVRFQQELDLQVELEQILIYFVYSYYCGSIYDGETFRKYQFAFMIVNMIEEFWFAQWKEQGEQLALEDRVRIVYRFAREIEHSDFNLDMLEEIYSQEQYEVTSMISIL